MATGLLKGPKSGSAPRRKTVLCLIGQFPAPSGFFFIPSTIRCRSYSKLSQSHDEHRLNRIKTKTMRPITENVNGDGYKRKVNFEMMLSTSFRGKIME